ncbi:MAG: MATE family efflux transporter [Salinivirgaceae bacterium]|jgi:MATE family multidrug resistance protein|nr:MATE family efflux transporter [Salinivirgaceae bacterium]
MNKKILNLAIPNIISNVTIPLLGIVDLAIVGHLESNIYIGAIAIGTMIFNLIYWTFAFLRMGTSGITAQALGARNFTEVMGTLIRGLVVAVASALLILALQIPIEKLAFFLIDGSSEIEQHARTYFYIRIWAAPATISLYAFTGWFIGMQNTKTPMIIALFINLLNIGLNYLFVYTFGLKSDGVAWGTLIAQYTGLVTAIVFLIIYYRKYFKYIKRSAILETSVLLKFFKVNSDILIRMISILAVFTFFTSKSASTNNNILAANTILLQFLFIFSFLTDGFAYAAEALTGKFYGAKQPKKLKKVIKLSFFWGIITALIFTFLYLFFNEQLLKLLTNQQDIIDVAKKYTIWIVLIPVVSVASFIWDGIFIGLTATKQMRNSMMISVFGVFFPLWWFLNPIYENHGLWFAFILFLFSRGFIQTIMFIRLRKSIE